MASASDPLNLPALHAWLRPHCPGLGALDELAAQRLPAGQSNPTWMLRCGHDAWVLRAKPAPVAELLPSAHAIEREVKVLRALADTPVAVPQVVALCEDESVLGVAFYVMAYVDGEIVRDVAMPHKTPAQRQAMHLSAVQTLAQLHRVDWQAKGLADFGRAGGYFERLIGRWTKQYRATQTEALPAMEQLIAWLPQHIPEAARRDEDTCLVHGDYRLENLMFTPGGSTVAAVLDWELSTLGHPLSDLAYHALAWHNPQGVLRGMAGLGLAALGIPSETEMMAAYCMAAGRGDLAQIEADWPFYLAFNCFRLAAIFQGIAQRVSQGVASHPQAMETARMAGPTAALGWQLAQAL